jgi:hypothetical protein
VVFAARFITQGFESRPYARIDAVIVRVNDKTEAISGRGLRIEARNADGVERNLGADSERNESIYFL